MSSSPHSRPCVSVWACRIHSICHTGSASFMQGAPWVKVYVDFEPARISAGRLKNFIHFSFSLPL